MPGFPISPDRIEEALGAAIRSLPRGHEWATQTVREVARIKLLESLAEGGFVLSKPLKEEMELIRESRAVDNLGDPDKERLANSLAQRAQHNIAPKRAGILPTVFHGHGHSHEKARTGLK